MCRITCTFAHNAIHNNRKCYLPSPSSGHHLMTPFSPHSFASLASKCLQEDPSKRCRMGDVVHGLGPLYFHSQPGQPLPRGLPPSTCPSSPEPAPFQGSTNAKVKSINSDVAHGPSPTPPLLSNKRAHVHREKIVAQIDIFYSTLANISSTRASKHFGRLSF